MGRKYNFLSIDQYFLYRKYRKYRSILSTESTTQELRSSDLQQQWSALHNDILFNSGIFYSEPVIMNLGQFLTHLHHFPEIVLDFLYNPSNQRTIYIFFIVSQYQLSSSSINKNKTICTRIKKIIVYYIRKTLENQITKNQR